MQSDDVIIVGHKPSPFDASGFEILEDRPVKKLKEFKEGVQKGTPETPEQGGEVNRMCIDCGNVFSVKREQIGWRKICFSCWDESRGQNCCEECGAEFPGRHWMKKCSACWHKGKRNV